MVRAQDAAPPAEPKAAPKKKEVGPKRGSLVRAAFPPASVRATEKEREMQLAANIGGSSSPSFPLYSAPSTSILKEGPGSTLQCERSDSPVLRSERSCPWTRCGARDAAWSKRGKEKGNASKQASRDERKGSPDSILPLCNVGEEMLVSERRSMHRACSPSCVYRSSLQQQRVKLITEEMGVRAAP
eukprot:883410-Pelagomonas_calceolata.AAC.4